MKRPPVNEWLSLFQATLAVESVTTGAGAGAGTSIIDAALIGAGANSYISMLLILYPGQPRLVDSQDITAFNNGTGEVTYAGAYKGVAAAIPAGVRYKIVTFRFVPAEVAALLADVGDASASTLGSLYAILGDPAQTFLAMIGYEGALSLANKLTAARAGYLDELEVIAGSSGIFHEQPDVAVSINAINGSETDVFDLSVASTRYIVRSLRLKCADPGVNTVIVRLYELVNDAPDEVTSFDIDAGNFGTSHSLMDMFGLPHLAGDDLQVTVRADAGGPYAVTAQYSHAKNNV